MTPTKYDTHMRDMLDTIRKHPGIMSGELTRLVAEATGLPRNKAQGVLARVMDTPEVKFVRNRNTGPHCINGYYLLYPKDHRITISDKSDLEPIKRTVRKPKKAEASVPVTAPLGLDDKDAPYVEEFDDDDEAALIPASTGALAARNPRRTPTIAVPVNDDLVLMSIDAARELRGWLNDVLK